MKGYKEMDETEIRKAVRKICNTSKSKEEISSRIKKDMGYPYGTPMVIPNGLPGKGDVKVILYTYIPDYTVVSVIASTQQ